MKKLIVALSLLLSFGASADVKITGLPLGTGASISDTDVLPYVDVSAGVTKKLKLADMVNIPAFIDAFPELAGPLSVNSVAYTDASSKLANDANFVWVTGTQRLGVGTSAPGVQLDIVGSSTTGTGQSRFTRYGATPTLSFREAGGTSSVPTKSVNGATLTTVAALGYQETSSAFTANAATISALATQDYTSTARGSQWVFSTTPNNSTTLTNALTIDQDQSANFTGNTSVTHAGADAYVMATASTDNYAAYMKLVGHNSVGASFNGIFSSTNAGTEYWYVGGAGVANYLSLRAGGVIGATLTNVGGLILPTYGLGILHSSSGGAITSSSVVNADIANSTIDLTAKVTGVLPNANTTGAVTNNVATLVLRDPTTGGFSAGPIVASLTGNVTGNVSGTAASFTGNLTGDVTSVAMATTLATVNSNVGSFGSSTSIPSLTVNGKGLVTAASGNAVIAPAGTLTGTTLASNVVTSSLTTVGTLASPVMTNPNLGTPSTLVGTNITGTAASLTAGNASVAPAGTLTGATLASGVTASSLTSVGTIATGVWNGTAVDATHGGTAQTSWATGDLLYASGSNTLTKRTVGSTGNVLTVAGGVPTWAAPATAGTVTSVAATVPAFMSIAGSPVTSSGTLAFTLSGTALPVLNGGTGVTTSTGTGNTVLSASPTLTGTPILPKTTTIGTASGVKTAIPQTDANILLYNSSSSNWAGIGADGSGNMWFRASTSGTPDANMFLSAGGGLTLTGATAFPGSTTVDASGNLGVGNASPSCKLDVSGVMRATGASAPSTGSGIELGYDGTQGTVQAYNRTGSAYLPILFDNLSYKFRTSGTDRFLIGSTGLMTVSTGFHTAGSSTGGTVTSGSASPAIASGTYTPTLTGAGGFGTISASAWQWIRVGNVVTVSGRFDATTATGANQVNASMPTTTANFAAATNAAGTFASAGTAANVGPILANAGAQTVALQLVTGVTATTAAYFVHFTYLVN